MADDQDEGLTFAAPDAPTQTPDAEEGLTFAEAPKPEPKPPAADYENMPWSEVAQRGLGNVGQSALNQIKAIPEAFANASEISKMVGQMGEVRRGEDVSPTPMERSETLTPAAIARHWVSPEESGVGNKMSDEDMKKQQVTREQFWDAVTKPYQSVANFKQALAEDPFQVLTTMSIPLTAGASGISTLGKIAGGLGKAMNPLGLAADAGGSLLSGAKNVAKGTISGLAGAPRKSLGMAEQSGELGNPEFRNAFNLAARGEQDPVELAERVRKAASNLERQQVESWINSKSDMMKEATADVPRGPIQDAINEVSSNLGPAHLSTAPESHAYVFPITKAINERFQMPSGSNYRTVLGFDQLKQELYNRIRQAPTPEAAQAMKTLWAGVKDSIGEVAPNYQNVMDEYSHIKNESTNIAKTLGTSNKVAANSALAKMIKEAKSTAGPSMFDKLGEVDPTIPYSVAGATLNDPRASGFWNRGLEYTGVAANMTGLAHALYSGDFGRAALHAAAIPVQTTLQSPYALGQIAQGYGSVKGSVGRLGQNAATMAGPEVSGMSNFYKDSLMKLRPALAGASMSVEKPLQRKAGGRVQKFDAKAKARALIVRAHRAKKQHNENTKPLLNEDDSSIAKALEISQQAI